MVFLIMYPLEEEKSQNSCPAWGLDVKEGKNKTSVFIE
jgi:hypothetical protein